MKAVVYNGTGDLALERVADPGIEQPTDAVVRITTSAICGTDLHFVRGTVPGMVPGTVLGHEGIGIVEEVGPEVRNFAPGDRVVIPSTIGCGSCVYCRAGYYAQCDEANPNGPAAGTAFYGGPASTGPFNGLQAELARIPYAHTNLVRLPDAVGDDDAVLCSDIFPTAWFGARLAEVSDGDVVLVLGAGIVGQLAVLSARLQGAGRIIVVDDHPDRLERAAGKGAETIDFDREEPVGAVRELTKGTGADRVIDAVGVDAKRPHAGPASQNAESRGARFDAELAAVAPDADATREQWRAGDGPSQALSWAVEAVAKAGTVGIIGVYPPSMHSFPVGMAMNKNLTVNLGNCNHRRYLPSLVELVSSGRVSLAENLTKEVDLDGVLDGYAHFDQREPGWLKAKVLASSLPIG